VYVKRRTNGGVPCLSSKITGQVPYPPACTTCPLRAPDRVLSAATGLGEFDGRFADQLLAGDFP
jgi:hypothetical protein